jgi:hypothetical protein
MRPTLELLSELAEQTRSLVRVNCRSFALICASGALRFGLLPVPGQAVKLIQPSWITAEALDRALACYARHPKTTPAASSAAMIAPSVDA